jgi:hypothetical protein
MLLGSIDQFLSIFQPDVKINAVRSEKGSVTKASIKFQVSSAFYYAEEKFGGGDYLVLDDLGGEWADHILINGSEIGFVHSKANTSKFSATAFTEIIGQAQKNMGSLNAVDSQIKRKAAFWKNDYQKDRVLTKIKRLRKGNSVDDFVKRYIRLKSEPNSRKSVYLVVNFISKALLETNLKKLRDDIQFKERKEAIQILWQISSLIASGREHNIGVYILCKP